MAVPSQILEQKRCPAIAGLEQKRCPFCRRRLFDAKGTDAVIQIKCTCSRIVTVAIGKEGGA